MLKKLEHLIKEKNFSGVVTIRKGTKLIFNHASGHQHRPYKIDNNLSTSFGIASGTKLFTALAILHLIDRQKLSLDDQVFNIIDQPYKTYDRKVTIQHLLSHTSGLPDYFDEDFITNFDNFKVDVPWHELEKPKDYMAVLPKRDMKFPVGSHFHYNNSGYILLAMVIEKLTGDFHTYIKESLLVPNGLKHTGFYRFDQLPDNCALGYIELSPNTYKTNIYSLPVIGGGDGGIYSNSEDLLNLWDRLMKDKIISKKLKELLIQPHNTEDPYGLGVWLTQIDDTYVPSIVGSDGGVSFVSAYRSDMDIIYNILSNTSEGAWDISKFIRENLSKI